MCETLQHLFYRVLEVLDGAPRLVDSLTHSLRRDQTKISRRPWSAVVCVSEGLNNILDLVIVPFRVVLCNVSGQ